LARTSALSFTLVELARAYSDDEQGDSVIDATIREAEQKMVKAVEHTREEFSAIRTGRAHPAMFSQITAEYYGTPTPLQQLAGFQVPEPRTVIISPYDAGAKSAIEKAIRDSDLGVNPTDDGKVLRVTLPELTEERRKEYIKLARTKAEDGRIAVRGVRRGAKQSFDKLEKDSEISKDDNVAAEKRLDALTKKHVEQIDEALKHKEAELLDV
jgi:ribosome recycling factor